MGRLEDIAERNKQAMRGDNLIVKAVGRGGTDKPPAEPASAFTLPSQRKSGTPVWKVLILMLLLGTVIGVYSCRQVQRDQEDVERRVHGG